MSDVRRGAAGRVLIVVIALLLIGVAVVYLLRVRGNQHSAAGGPATAPVTTQAGTATSPATQAAAPEPPPTTQYIDVVKKAYPRLPATQPLGVPVGLSDAARFILNRPVYISPPPRRDLWITHPAAPPVEEILKDLISRQDKGQLMPAVRDEVVYVHWQPQDRGPWTFEVVCRSRGGGFEVVTQRGRKKLPWDRQYQWERAVEWNERVIVPTLRGVSVLRFSPDVTESHFDIVGADHQEEVSRTQIMLDWSGFLAWIPWDGERAGSRGAVRFNEDRWELLPPDRGWPEKPIQLMPLSDGSVLTISAGEEPGTAKLATVLLEELDINREQIEALVADLSHEEEETRKAAFERLAGYGPGVWPVLEELLPDEPPEAQARLRQLLKNKVAPSLGPLTLVGDKLTAVTRHADGGVLLYAEAGVSIPTDDTTPLFRTPAWIDVRPGLYGPVFHLLDHLMVKDLSPDKARVQWFQGDWIVTSNARGPRRFVGNGFLPLLSKEDTSFSEVVGVDVRGRWVFREPASAGTTKRRTLIIDPTIPDPTRRLPVWIYTTADAVGWTEDDWPAVKRKGTWVLKEHGWEALDEKKTRMLTSAKDAPPPLAPPLKTHDAPAQNQDTAQDKTPATAPDSTTGATSENPPDNAPDASGATATDIPPATTPPTNDSDTPTATKPATAPAARKRPATAPADWGDPILFTPEGLKYYDGLTHLKTINADGDRATWQLPPIANGTGPAHLIRTKDGTLFLFNQPGRVLRIRPTPEAKERYEIEATFTERIPSVKKPTRIWLDPAGRIVIAYESQMAFLFAEGFIPPRILEKIPADQLNLDDR